ncbi:MAG: restriction endonuclease subunit S [Muribaculaceae bacterium]|nr:restriction endonuclease subunit S [Alistipes senegalensis]MCM1472753.1 restriction endonuclease subunit S [Muribaculaceae bacterium]
MKSKWKTCCLDELVTIKYGKNQKKVVSDNGKFPIYGTGGLMGYATEPLYNKPSVLIGRKGTINKIRYVDYPFWTVDTLFYTIINEDIVIPRFLYYTLLQIDFMRYNEGTTIPSLRTETLNRLEISLPDLETQKKISSVLSVLDDKIELNNRMNKNLEEQAQAIFKSWFVDFEPFGNIMPENWKIGILGSFIEIKRGGSPRPIQEFLSDTGYRWLKISDVTGLDSPYILEIKEHIKESGLKKTVYLKKGSLVLSNSATPGIPKILDVDSCIHDGWLYFPKSQFSNEYLYLLFKYIRKDLIMLGNGSIFTNLKTDILKQFKTIIPDRYILDNFQNIIKPIFDTIKNISNENQSLSALRDTLLPKFMNGEIDISKIKEVQKNAYSYA